MRNRGLWITALIVGITVTAQAQWVHYPTPGLQRTKDNKPDLNAPAPRMRDGKPDLSGVWQAAGAPIPLLMKLLPGGQNGLGEDVPSQYFIDIFVDFERAKEPLKPAALAASAKLTLGTPATAGNLACLPSGLPIFLTMPAPFKIVQTRGLTVMMSEGDESFRQIFTDGRPFPADPTPSWLGSSVGRWEGDTFVVDSIGFNNRGVLDALGHRHSDKLRVTERYHRVNAGRMNVALLLTDPQVLTRPVTVKFDLLLRADTDLIEYFCTENERDRQRIHG